MKWMIPCSLSISTTSDFLGLGRRVGIKPAAYLIDLNSSSAFKGTHPGSGVVGILTASMQSFKTFSEGAVQSLAILSAIGEAVKEQTA
jgi:hypothetical protein